MSNFSTLKGKILAIATANSLVSSGFDYDSPTVDDTPCVLVVPSGNEADYATTAHNKRWYAFTVTILVPYDPQGAQSAEITLLEVVDSLIDDFDQDFTLTGSALMMTASPSAWGYQQRERLYRTATINLKCMTQFNVTA